MLPHLPFEDDLLALRKRLKNSTQQIEVQDFGAGSRKNNGNRRAVASIVRNAEKPVRFGQFFARLVQHFRPKHVLELGTSLGLTTLYFRKATPQLHMVTMEGCPQTAALARAHFAAQDAADIALIEGNIDETLPRYLADQQPRLDMVFFDANHRYEPTVRYFEACLPYAHNDTVFIFDDLYWSAEMTEAWAYIKAHPRVSVTIDLFWVGIVFFRKEQPKEHFRLRL